MDIERLKEWANTQNIGTANMSYHKAQEHVLEIINESNQVVAKSATSEEVAEAIKDLTMLSNVWQEIGQPTKELDIAITALQAYEPKGE